jgi:hypothetical protein
MDSDPTQDNANHTLYPSTATTDPIDQSSSESDFENGGEVYLVGQGDPPLAKTTKEI